jgi:hypothetical protein
LETEKANLNTCNLLLLLEEEDFVLSVLAVATVCCMLLLSLKNVSVSERLVLHIYIYGMKEEGNV